MRLFLDVDADELAPGAEQFSGDRSHFAGSDSDAIKFCSGHDAVRSAGEKCFVGGGDIVGEQLAFLDRDFQLTGQLEDGLAADAIQAVDGTGSFNAALRDQEKVAAFVLGEKTIGIQDQTLGHGVDQFDFRFGHGVDEAAAVFDACIE